MTKYLGRFSCQNDYPNQCLEVSPGGGFVWSLNDETIFEMHFNEDGEFEFSLQEDLYDGVVLRIEMPNGRKPEPLEKWQMDIAKGYN